MGGGFVCESSEGMGHVWAEEEGWDWGCLGGIVSNLQGSTVDVVEC